MADQHLLSGSTVRHRRPGVAASSSGVYASGTTSSTLYSSPLRAPHPRDTGSFSQSSPDLSGYDVASSALRAQQQQTSSLLDLSGLYSWLYEPLYQLLRSLFGWSSFSFQMSDATRQCIQEFKTFSSQVYDSTSHEHERTLLELWQLSYPEHELDNRLSSKWTMMGFQNKDPASDFRGAGIFGLTNLVYMASRYPRLYRSLLRGLHAPPGAEQYPFAIAGLNLTMVLFGMLGWGMRVATGKANVPQSVRDKLLHMMFADNNVRPLVSRLASNHAAARERLAASTPALRGFAQASDGAAPGDIHTTSTTTTTSTSSPPPPSRQRMLIDFGDGFDVTPSATTNNVEDDDDESPLDSPQVAQGHRQRDIDADDEQSNSIGLDDSLESMRPSGLEDDQETDAPHRRTPASSPAFGVSDDELETGHRRFIFDELYCFLFHLFDKEWYSARATYMQFPMVLEAAQARFQEIVAQSNFSFEYVLRMNDAAESNATN